MLNVSDRTGFQEYLIAKSLWRFLAPPLLLLGTVGNCLTFVVLQSRSFRNGAIGFALSALTVVDSALLWTSLLRQCIVTVTGFDLRSVSAVGCKVHYFAACYLSHLSSWTVVTLSVERALSISRPFLVKFTSCSRKRVTFAWVGVVVVLACVNVHFFWNAKYSTVVIDPCHRHSVSTESEQSALSSSSGNANPSEENSLHSSGLSSQLVTDFRVSAQQHSTLNRSSESLHPTITPRTKMTFNSIDYSVSFKTSIYFSLSEKSSHSQGQIQGYGNEFSLTDGIRRISTSHHRVVSVHGPQKFSPSLKSDDAVELEEHENFNCSDSSIETNSYCFVSYLLQGTIWPWTDNALFVVFPFTFIITSNMAVVVRLWRSNSVARGHDIVGEGRLRPITSSTMMLMAVSTAFLLTTTPLAIHLIGVTFWSRNGNARTMARIELSHCICSLVYYAGSSINFLLYCFSGSRFRRALRDTLPFLRRTRPSNRRLSRGRLGGTPMGTEYVCSLRTLRSINLDRRMTEDLRKPDPNTSTF